jgi:predicted nucleic acid-binding protein
LKGYLLDTNIVSMLSPSATQAPQSFLDWLDRADAVGQLFLSVVTIHEIGKGIALLDHKGAASKAAALKLWLVGLVSTYEDKILAIDAIAASLGGQLEAKAAGSGHNPGMADAAIAGIAKAHDLMIVTANTKDFLPFGVGLVAPDDVTA